MQAQRRTLMFLLALTALAAAALALLTCTARRQEAAGREEEAGAIPLSAFAAKELTALTYTRAGQTVSLLYDGGAWAVAGAFLGMALYQHLVSRNLLKYLKKAQEYFRIKRKKRQKSKQVKA